MSLNETIFWALPYNVRQKIYQIVRKDKFNNQVTRRDYTKYYSAETAEIVEKVYKKDIELLGYKFLQP